MSVDLSESGIEGWIGILPSPIQARLRREAPGLLTPNMEKLLSSAGPADLLPLCADNREDFSALGVAQRVRLLAWLAWSDQNHGTVFEQALGETPKETLSTPEREVSDIFRQDALFIQRATATPQVKSMIAASGGSILAAKSSPAKSLVAPPAEQAPETPYAP